MGKLEQLMTLLYLPHKTIQWAKLDPLGRTDSSVFKSHCSF